MSKSLEITIRVADSSDAKGILTLCKKIGKETPFLTFGPAGIHLSVEQEASLINKYTHSKSSLLVIAETDEKIVGMANLTEFSQEKQNHVAEMGVCVLKEYHGVGIATQMLEMLIEFVEHTELKVITLEVARENIPAIHLYRKFGFVIVGTLSKRLRVEDDYLDSYLMEKVLE